MIRSIALISASALLGACASNTSYESTSAPPLPLPTVVASVYLVGDAGDDSPGRDRVLAAVRSDLEDHRGRHPGTPALVAFLGDNIYDVGARPEFRGVDRELLAAQVDVVPDAPGIQGIFLPGNHDWGKGAGDPDGQSAIEVQRRWIDEIAAGRQLRLLPTDSCAAPAVVDVARDVHLVFIDTEWLLRRPNDPCGGVDRFYERLEEALASRRGGRLILAAHHPMTTGGPHGGNVSLFENVPILYYLAVKSGMSVQDLGSGRYSDMIQRLRRVIRESGAVPIAIASGHDHSLQVIRMSDGDGPYFQLVSGSASKSSAAKRIEGTRYATSAHGYMRLDFTGDDVRVVTYALADDDAVRPVFACSLAVEAGRSCPEARLRGRSP
ncbi:MAG: metallophosphoesterase [Gemmatimonadota bacterium]|nr:metallophosphoesterase [Gemmatimonadota bacterium]